MLPMAIVYSLTMVGPASIRKTVRFPRGVLRKFLADSERAVPGTRIDSPTIEADGLLWQVSLYPFGGNAEPSYAGRVGVYLRLLQFEGSMTEVDANFAMSLTVISEAEAAAVMPADDGHGSKLDTRFKNNRCAGLFRAYAYPALYPEETQSTRIRL